MYIYIYIFYLYVYIQSRIEIVADCLRKGESTLKEAIWFRVVSFDFSPFSPEDAKEKLSTIKGIFAIEKIPKSEI